MKNGVVPAEPKLIFSLFQIYIDYLLKKELPRKKNHFKEGKSKDMCMCLVTQPCSTLHNPMDCSPPGFSVHEIFQARILEWVAIPFSRGSS